ncbi:uncharacterized protein LOC126804410 [Argentina anserina]|uniref:uncharacterized protein LOC126804410 n=1 Tax=Argentina anserina TaxID=57926 RepID=UPI0021762139|nr:uncharacterized protein LOC126804410 [Potentilla anserina]
MAVDYHTKWIEAEPMAKITMDQGVCHRNGTTVLYASLAHPQTNGQVEAVNKLIKKYLKKRLNEATRLWAQKLPEVLWALRTIPTAATGQSLFLLGFGTEAVFSVEIEVPSERVESYDQDINVVSLQLNMDLLEKRREKAHLRNINGKQRISKHYNKQVCPWPMVVSDWVMNEVRPRPVGLNLK